LRVQFKDIEKAKVSPTLVNDILEIDEFGDLVGIRFRHVIGF
jgi:hypothetical protein